MSFIFLFDKFYRVMLEMCAEVHVSSSGNMAVITV